MKMKDVVIELALVLGVFLVWMAIAMIVTSRMKKDMGCDRAWLMGVVTATVVCVLSAVSIKVISGYGAGAIAIAIFSGIYGSIVSFVVSYLEGE